MRFTMVIFYARTLDVTYYGETCNNITQENYNEYKVMPSCVEVGSVCRAAIILIIRSFEFRCSAY